jgi:hypothetical protein
MLNSYNNNAFRFDVNAVSGTLRKSHPKSKFIVREVDWNSYVFNSENPKLTCNGTPIVILQVMLTGNKNCIIEYVSQEDFEQ